MAELLISFAILASLSVLLVGVIPATILGLRSATERATASLLVQSAMEQSRKQNFAKLGDISFRRELNGQRYSVTTTVMPAFGSDGTALDSKVAKAIRVEVKWTAKAGDKVETFESIITRSPH